MQKTINIILSILLLNFLIFGCISIAKEESIEIGDPIKLKADYYGASNSKGRALILLHMLGRNKSDWKKFALFMKSKGYSSVAINFRNNGNATEQMLLQDVDTAYKFLKQKQNTKIIIIGASIGANTALNFAEINKEINAIVLLSPGLNYRNVKTESTMKNYSGRSILIVASYEDKYSAESSAVLDKIARGKHKLILYHGAGHGTNMLLNEKKLKEEIFTFVKQEIN